MASITHNGKGKQIASETSSDSLNVSVQIRNIPTAIFSNHQTRTFSGPVSRIDPMMID